MDFISYIIYRAGYFMMAETGEINVNPSNWSLLDIIGQFLLLTAAFIFIVFIAVYSLRFAAKFRYSGGNSNLRIIETRQLGGQNFVHIIKAGDKYIMVGSSKENVTLLTELEREAVSDVFETVGQKGFESQLSAQLKKLFNRDIPPEE